jgi:CRISPR-associated protein Cst2
MPTTIRSLSIAARVVLDLHALNNEGSESNRLMTRQVGIVTPTTDAEGKPGFARSVVNAISGDMEKHIFADYFRNIALEMGLPLCDACKALDPARMMGNEEFRNYIKGKPAVPDVIDRLLTCALDDVCGILVTGEGTSVKRKSAVEFGWTVGLPDVTEVQEFIHARHAINRLTRTKAGRDADEELQKQAQTEKEQNTGQMIFNRPASSGVYAFVAHLDACAIGFNDATRQYIDAGQREVRLRAALIALVQTLIHPKGALTSTQLPHVVDMQGFVSLSGSAAAAPLLSPLHDDFLERGQQIAAGLNRLYGGEAVAVLPFDGQPGLLDQFDSIKDALPGVYGG